MGDLIHMDQKGFMSDRKISTNIRKICDLMTYADINQISANIISLDFHKAFDTISFDCLQGALRFFNFGENIRQWTATLYNMFKVRVQNNGYFSDFIEIERGVHQGGCCSSYYFLLCAELLAILVRENKHIRGITIREVEYLLGLFADDTDTYTLHDQQTIAQLFNTIEYFGDMSGLTINYDKTSIYRVGSLKNTNARLYTQRPIQWTNNPINILGVWIDHDEDVMTNLNYETLIKKTENILDKWSNRTLSLVGKIQVINSLVASLFVYKMTVIPSLPRIFLEKINRIYKKFLWGGTAKIPSEILYLSKKEGGLGLVDLTVKDKALKISWIKNLDEDENFANLAYELINPTLRHKIWHANLHPKDVNAVGCKNKFWTNVIQAWAETNFIEDVLYPEHQIIWLNSHIRQANKPFLWEECHDVGLMYMKDLLDSSGNFKSDYQLNKEFKLKLLQINTLKSAIPSIWVKRIKNKIKEADGSSGEINDGINENEINVQEIIKAKQPVKTAYSKIMLSQVTSKNKLLVKKWGKWNEDNVIDSLFPGVQRRASRNKYHYKCP